MSEYVYNPDDEEDKFTFNGTNFTLVPNSVTAVDIPRDDSGKAASHWEGVAAQDIAAHAAVILGKWGVRWIPRTVFLTKEGKGKAEYDEILNEAEEVYKAETEKWATDVMVGYYTRNAKNTQHSLPNEKLTTDESSAQSWLKSQGLLPKVK